MTPERLRRRATISAAAARVLAVLALAGCGTTVRLPLTRHGPSPRPGAAAPAVLAATARRAYRAAAGGSWLIDPDGLLALNSPWWRVLSVARRFAELDMSYEVDQVGPATRQAIVRTCTPAFAAELLSRRAILPPGVGARQVRQRLVAVQPIERLPGVAVVLVTVRGAVGQPGAFELRLVPRPGGWRVAAMSIV